MFTKTPPCRLPQIYTHLLIAGFHCCRGVSFGVCLCRSRSGGRCSGASAGSRRNGSRGLGRGARGRIGVFLGWICGLLAYFYTDCFFSHGMDFSSPTELTEYTERTRFACSFGEHETTFGGRRESQFFMNCFSNTESTEYTEVL